MHFAFGLSSFVKLPNWQHADCYRPPWLSDWCGFLNSKPAGRRQSNADEPTVGAALCVCGLLTCKSTPCVHCSSVAPEVNSSGPLPNQQATTLRLPSFLPHLPQRLELFGDTSLEQATMSFITRARRSTNTSRMGHVSHWNPAALTPGWYSAARLRCAASLPACQWGGDLSTVDCRLCRTRP